MTAPATDVHRAAPTRPPAPADWAGVVALSILWGSAFVNVRVALDSFGPLTLAALRITIGAAVLCAAAAARGQRLPRAGDGARWRAIAGMAVFSNALPFALLGWGQQFVASGFAGLTMAASPIFTLLLAVRLVPGERLTRWRVLGLCLGLAGVVVLMGPAALARGGADQVTLARIACIASALCYAIGAVITRLSPPMPLLAKSAANLLVAAALIVPLALAVEGWPAMPTPAGALAVLYLGLLPTAAATLLMVALVTRTGPTFVTLSTYQVPVWALVLGALAFGERLPPSFLLALTLILAGIAVSQRPAARRPAPR